MKTVLLSKWTNTLCACRSRAWIRAWNFEPQPYIIFVHNFPYQGFLPVWHHIFLSTLQFCLQGPFSYLSAVASWYGILWICRLLLCQKLWDLTMAGDWSESVRGSWCRKIAGKKWQNSTWCRDAHTALSSAAKQFWAQSGKKLYLTAVRSKTRAVALPVMGEALPPWCNFGEKKANCFGWQRRESMKGAGKFKKGWLYSLSAHRKSHTCSMGKGILSQSNIRIQKRTYLKMRLNNAYNAYIQLWDLQNLAYMA